MTVHQPIEAADARAPYRFNQRDYALLAEHGAFDRFAKAELIEGTIIAVNAQYSRHARAQTLLLRRLADACEAIGSSAWLDTSIAINDANMPQPDIFVVRDLPEDGPVPVSALLLVIEVADSSLDHDLGAKAALYASAGVAEYWVADVNGRTIHQLWSPTNDAYAQRRTIAFGNAIASMTISDLTIDTTGL